MIESWKSLSPVRFLDRASAVFGDRLAVVDGAQSFSYRDLAARSAALTGLLAARGIGPGDKVAALCSNSHVMLELHNGVPMRGAVLVPLNVRLSQAEMQSIVDHSEASLLIVTREFTEIGNRLSEAVGIPVLHADDDADGGYEAELANAHPARTDPADERSLLAINYTSGTTGSPKGVMYHHRGAYLQALAMAYHVNLRPGSSYLWTLPMFHCNGWCFPWAVTAAGATHVCLRTIDTDEIWRRLRGGVTHFSAAPTVLAMIADHDGARDSRLETPVEVSTGGAPPSPTLLRRMSELNLRVTHLYGLTETFGPVMVNEWQPEWDTLDDEKQAQLQARQGIPNIVADVPRVANPTGRDVPKDGETIGELLLRGNDLMLGYFRNAKATEAAETDGWFRTGDLAVQHRDGYIEVRDRLKDIIISGGENIASVEVERCLDSHAAVLESAVVGVPDARWGEVPVAFVTLRAGADVTSAELMNHVRQRLARFKVPKRIIFGSLPRTSTGKIRKSELRKLSEQI